MRRISAVILLAPALVGAAYGQPSGKIEFEVASIKPNAPASGFHLASDAATGGPGTADPGMFRCSKCSLATLIIKAFNLQPYQFPGRRSLGDGTYDIQAKIPADATGEQFSAMLQNLLKDRFGLAWHFEEKKMKGYQLVVAKNGPKLTESAGSARPQAADSHRFGQGESHNHSGPVVFGDSAIYRANGQTMGDLARALSDQIGLPVNDETGLPGKYDISLRWSGAGSGSPGNHGGGFSGGSRHAGHEDGGGAVAGGGSDSSGPTLFYAIQEQLGLRLVPAEQAVARLLVVDRVNPRPTEN